MPNESDSIDRAQQEAALVRKFNTYKLETEFHDDCVVHTTYEWDLSTKLRKESTWKQEKEIGSGAFGSVWLEKEKGGQLRAVKVLHQKLSPVAGPSQELLAMLKLQDYDHLFVKFYGWYENRKNTFIAMEYIMYGDLVGYIGQGKAKACAKEITRQILEGLEVLHGKNIFHRDLKPQNILIASPDPIWVKITDFGISKREKGTKLRTMCGTDGYMAPELQGLLPRKLIPKPLLGHALDIWSLGSLTHELLTSQTPFADTDEESGSETAYSMTELPLQRGTDTTLLWEYCGGSTEFPTEALRESEVDEEGIAFVKSLLVPDPKKRPTATIALQNSWVKGYTSDWFENLRNEFLRLGTSLCHKDILARQARKADILQFLPTPKEKILSLLLDATSKGYTSAVSKLLESPSREPIDPLTRGKLLQLAIEAREHDTIKILLHHKVNVDARIDDQTLLQWAIKAGHTKTAIQLIENNASLSNSIEYEGLLLAISLRNSNVVRAFLGKTIDISLTTALESAIEVGDIGIVKLLLENKANVNFRGSKGRTALQAAAGGGHIDIVKLLLDNKADVNGAAAGNSGRTALQAAAGGGHIDIAKLLLDNGADASFISPREYKSILDYRHTAGYRDP